MRAKDKDNVGLIEECLDIVPDCFRLVVLASYRAQELSMGASSAARSQGNKNTVVALKEIAQQKIDLHELEDHIISSFQQFSFLSHKSL